MGESIDARKIKIISRVTALQDDAELTLLEHLLEQLGAAQREIWVETIRPIREHQSIEDMVREQNYKGFDRAEFDRLIAELDIQDPEGELLKMATP